MRSSLRVRGQPSPWREKFRELDGEGNSVELNFPKEKQAGELECPLPNVRTQTAGTAGLESAVPRLKFFRVEPTRSNVCHESVIDQLVAGIASELTSNHSRFLSRRGLTTTDGKLAFPILARWLQEYAD